MLAVCDVAIEARFSSLEARMSTIVNSADIMSNDHGVAEEDLIKCAVEVEVKRKAEEEKDLEARKHNIIIF